MSLQNEPRPLNTTERVLQRWRQNVALPWIRRGDRVLDVGCYRGEFLYRIGDRITESVGVDPLVQPATFAHYRLEPLWFTDAIPYRDASFDAIVLLASLEHIRDKAPLARESMRLLRAEGRIIITVPSPQIDVINDLLRFLRITDGMSTEQHHGFQPHDVPSLFPKEHFTLECHRRFECGLNHLFVFRRLR